MRLVPGLAQRFEHRPLVHRIDRNLGPSDLDVRYRDTFRFFKRLTDTPDAGIAMHSVDIDSHNYILKPPVREEAPACS